MFRLRNIQFIFTFAILLASISARARQKQVYSHTEMGSPFTITIYTNDSLQAAFAARKAFEEVNRLNEIFSDYMDSSELNRLCRTSGKGIYVKVSSELFEILELSLNASRLSGGAFDITVGPMVKLWRRARRERKFPDKNKLKYVKQAVGYRYIHLDSLQQSVKLERPDMQLDLGGIAKGYAAQKALEVIKKAGFSAVMVNAGGDMVLGDPPPDKSDWMIGIALPESNDEIMNKLIHVKNQAVATSGDIYQYVEWKGKRYSHIVDPKTGLGVTYLRNVTVIAGDGATADWLASACSILSIKKSMKLIQHIPNASVLIAEKRGDSTYRAYSKDFERYFKRF